VAWSLDASTLDRARDDIAQASGTVRSGPTGAREVRKMQSVATEEQPPHSR
jgi:hypothetical protein